MLASRLFWKVFVAYAALTLVSAMAFVIVLSGHEREIIVERARKGLHDLAVVLQDDFSGVFARGAGADLQALLQRLARQTGTRVTLIADDGTVLGDSARNPAVMDNHRSREELVEASRRGSGYSQRPSATLGVSMMYFALRVMERDRTVGFVRVAMPMKSVDAQVASMRRLIVGTIVVVSLIALAVTYFVVGRIIRPLANLTYAAKEIADGRLDHKVDVTNRDELGTLAGAFNSMSEQLAARIEELQRKGQELAENSERLETVLSGMVEGVIAVNNEHRVLLANAAARSLLDIAFPDVAGRLIWEVIRDPTIQAVMRDAMQTEGQRTIEFDVPETQSVIALLAARLPGDPCPGIVLVLHDMTELRRLENIRREFVSNVSHELKTPLTSIQAYTETLLAGAVDDPSHNRVFLQQVQQQADRLHALIMDLLQLARIESGKIALEITSVPVAKIIDTSVKQRLAVCESKQIMLTTDPAVEQLAVIADAQGVQTILDNLVDNAINYTPDGGCVTIRWRATGANVEVDIEDTGIGIGAQHLDRIFERFYRVDQARAHDAGGTGLGLSIVKHLVHEFNGTVAVRSHVGVGTTFTIRLPRGSIGNCREDECQDSPTTAAAQPRRANGNGCEA